MSSLQAVPIPMAGGATLYIDLRIGSSHSLLIGSPWEVDEQDVMRRMVMVGEVAFDIGAHLGTHTVLLSQLVGPNGRVYAFEPNPAVLPSLRHTIRALGHVSLQPFALSDQSGQATLYVPGDHSMASLANWTRGEHGKTHKISCQTQRLDDLVESKRVPQPDFIKCDAEGAELIVFRGGRKALDQRTAPILLFEANVNTARGFGLTIASAMNFLASLELAAYSFFEIRQGGSLVSVKTAAFSHRNILAVPYSKLYRLRQSKQATHAR